MDIFYEPIFEAFGIGEACFPGVGKAARGLSVLVQDGLGRAFGLVFHDAVHGVGILKVVVFPDLSVEDAQGDEFFVFVFRVGRVVADDVGSQHDFFVARYLVFVVEVGKRAAAEVFRDGRADYGTVFVGVQPDEAGGFFLVGDGVPFAEDVVDGRVGHVVVRVDADVELGIRFFIGEVVPGVHAAVFFVEVPDFDFVFFLPGFNQPAGVVCGPVVDDHPEEVPAGLAAEAFIEPRQEVGAVVGGGENG